MSYVRGAVSPGNYQNEENNYKKEKKYFFGNDQGQQLLLLAANRRMKKSWDQRSVSMRQEYKSRKKYTIINIPAEKGRSIITKDLRDPVD